jgi:hypothetical protein
MTATDSARDMSRAERIELAKLARMRAKVARTQVDHRAAELRADVERQLSAEYDFGDEAWAEITSAAAQAVKDANRVVAAKCQERGIPTEFAPSLSVSWYGRGRNAEAGRRAELRKTAQTAIEAQAKQAKATIEVKSLDVQTELLAGGLSTSAAHAFLAAMPTPAELMPAINVKMLGGASLVPT